MSLINICGLTKVIDCEYRYKMPAVICGTESSGNGIKTAIINYKSIGDHLHRSPEELVKFMEYNLHTKSKCTYDRLLLNGNFTKEHLQSCIYEYIETFVLCKVCRLPETVYRYKKKDLMYKCMSCGHRDFILDKLSKFIIKHQPKKEKKDKKKNAKKKESEDKNETAEEDIIWFTDLSAESVAQRASENPFI